MLSAGIRRLVGKKRCPLPVIRTTGGRKEPSGWRKKRNDVGQVGGSGGIDKISSEGRPRLYTSIKHCEKNRVATGIAIFTASSFILKYVQ